jgi:hypothetical protein
MFVFGVDSFLQVVEIIEEVFELLLSVFFSTFPNSVVFGIDL